MRMTKKETNLKADANDIFDMMFGVRAATGEERLSVAILYRALMDLFSWSPDIRRAAENFMNENKRRDYVFSYFQICERINFDAKGFRTKILQLREQTPYGNKLPHHRV